MPRAAANEAKQAFNTASGNANQIYGQLQPQAQSLINSKGYDPQTLGAITNAGMGGVNAAFNNAQSQLSRNTARTKNQASGAGQLDVLARERGIAGGKEAGDIQMANADFANQQRMAGLNLLAGMYGSNLETEVPAINARTQASPGWARTTAGLLTAVSPKGLIAPPSA